MNNTTDIETLFALESHADGLPEVSPSYNLSSLRFLEEMQRGKSEALKSFIAVSGWPTAARFSAEVEEEAFMIAQHADYDPAFQMHCHQIMRELAKQGKLRLGYLAFMTDRILCNQGKHQRFGTQIREADNGCFVPKPIEDPEKVDGLRAEAGLSETLAEYFNRVNTGDVVLHPRMADTPPAAPGEKIIPFPGTH